MSNMNRYLIDSKVHIIGNEHTSKYVGYCVLCLKWNKGNGVYFHHT